MGTIKAIITIYSCLEAVDSAVLAKTGKNDSTEKSDKEWKIPFFFFLLQGTFSHVRCVHLSVDVKCISSLVVNIYDLS